MSIDRTFEALLRDLVGQAVGEAVRGELRTFFAEGGPAARGNISADDVRLITVKDAATLVSVHPKTVWAWIREGKLAAHGSGKLTRVRPSDVEAQFKRTAPEGAIDFAARAQAMRDGKK